MTTKKARPRRVEVPVYNMGTHLMGYDDARKELGSGVRVGIQRHSDPERFDLAAALESGARLNKVQSQKGNIRLIDSQEGFEDKSSI